MYIPTKRKFSGNWNWKGRYHTEKFHQFKNDFLDKFNQFKTNFLHKVKSFKDNIHNTTPKNTGNQEHIIALLLVNVTFLKDQLRQKEKVIDSLINQFSLQNNYLFQKRNTEYQPETNLQSVKSKENVKLKETEKITTTANNNKTEKGKAGKTQKQRSATTKTVNKIFHMKLNL